MDDLTIDQLKELVNFYKQRVSDSELNVLQTQLRLKGAIELIAQLEYLNRELNDKIKLSENSVFNENVVEEPVLPSKTKKTKSG